MVSIRPLNSNQHFAGGVLIGVWWVLTGAHYMLERANNSLNLMLGIIDLASTGQLRQSNLIVINPLFDRVTRQNE